MPSATTDYPTPLTTTIQNPRLKLLNGLKDGKFPLMTFMALPSVRMAQIVALTGFEGKLIAVRHSMDVINQLYRNHYRCRARSPWRRIGSQLCSSNLGSRRVTHHPRSRPCARYSQASSRHWRPWYHGTTDQQRRRSQSRSSISTLPSPRCSWARLSFPCYWSRSYDTRVHEVCQPDNHYYDPNRDSGRS